MRPDGPINFRITEFITDNTIILPLFYTMTDEEQDYVIDCIEQVRP